MAEKEERTETTLEVVGNALVDDQGKTDRCVEVGAMEERNAEYRSRIISNL